MTPELIDEGIVCLALLYGFLFVLGVGGILADYVLPRIPAFKRWMDSLPDWDDENED